MEPVLIYTDSSFVDVGAIQTFGLDMAFGSDEQDFEISFSKPELKGGELLYIDGTEYGGIVDSVTHSTETDQTVYKGRTWHGMLAGKIVKPPTGSDYYTLSGDANTCIRSLLSYVELDDVLTGRTAASGITVNYQFNRFTNAYNGLLRMLSDAGAVLRIERHDGITEVWAEPRVTIEDEADSDLMDFAITDSVRVPNHLVAAGEGDLQERVVVDLYADENGNVSQTQTLFGVDEIAVFYNYNNADRDELISDGTKELQEYQQGGGADLQVNSKGDWHVGDSIRVRDNRSGLVITSTIAKKIVKVERGAMTVDYEIGDAAAQSYGGGATAETNLVTPIANGGTGATTAQGALANLGFSQWKTVSQSDFMTLNSGWSVIGFNCRYNAALKRVLLQITLTASSAQTAGNKTVATVKSPYRPPIRQTVSVTTGSSDGKQVGPIYIDNGGNMNLYTFATSGSYTYYFAGEYSVG